ncbi:MAG: DNA repair protein RadC [Xanthomonadales bacterium]|nr:DNA repair protein RadC [Xanthomonadales bacterium]
MSHVSLTDQSTLYVRDGRSCYRSVSDAELFAATRNRLGVLLQRDEPLTDPTKAVNYLMAHFAGYEREAFVVVHLDTRHRVIAIEEAAVGTIAGASVYPREIVKSVLAHNASAVLFSHNHPSGVPEPSGADRRLTERLRDALSLVDVCVLDHLVLAGDQHVSFAQRGLL